MKVKNDPKFINRSNGNKLFRQTGYVHSDETKQKLRTWERTEAYKQKLKDAAKSKPDIKDSTRKLMSIAHSKPYTEERKLQHIETMRNLSEESRKRCGHNKGKHLSEETKAKLRKPKKRTT